MSSASVESVSISPAISPGPGSGIDCAAEARRIPETDSPEPGPNPGTGTEDDDWFIPVVFAVFGEVDAGRQLYLATGWPRTSCYAFVARDPAQRRKLPSEFLRRLFHSAHGAPFFRAFMSGAAAPWWLDQQRMLRNAAKVEALDLE